MNKDYRKVKKYLLVIKEARRRDITPIREIGALACDYKENNVLPKKEEFHNFTYGDYWGKIDSHVWFRVCISSKTNTYLSVRTDFEGWDADKPQFIAYINGKMVQGLDINHKDLKLPDNTDCEVYLYGYTGFAVDKARFFVDSYTLDKDVNDLYFDIKYPFDILPSMDEESADYACILTCLYNAVSLLDLYSVGSADFLASVKEARNYLEKEFYGKYCEDKPYSVACIGHTHIDCAWLWTLKQTREKVQRSFSTVLELMNRYPEYKFMSSQALLYKYMKEEAPDKYEEIKRRIKEGRWEVEGSMWVEADCNLSSGESLIRQIVYGKKFFKEEFGVDTRVLWLPDVFGYSAALPQILKNCGVEWFLTSKISWNDTNRMPYDTFLWKGLDGTTINSYFLTAQVDNGNPSVNYAVYVGETDSKWITGTYKRYQQKQISDSALLTFGFGDGGGGPTEEQLEYLKRGKKGFGIVPNAKQQFAGEFLDELKAKMDKARSVPLWSGELYLEYHRGTYTTMAKNKRNNRKSEFLLHNAELYSVLSHHLQGKEIPMEKLHTAWELLLTNQFHDIIPGSSIKEVYEDSDLDYEKIACLGNDILSGAQKEILDGIDENSGFVVFNPTPFSGKLLVQKDGKSVVCDNIPANGYCVENNFIESNHIKCEENRVETDIFVVCFDEYWQISSIYDKRCAREIIRVGEMANELRVYADYPDDYDAWEWQEYSKEDYKGVHSVERAEVVQDGVKLGVHIFRRFMNSTIEQTIWFFDDIERIDFETRVDWHEKHLMLKTAFPVEIHTEKALYDVQFGNVERPTHFNTSWEQAKFEVCAHKFADVSDGSYGVSLVNDCKYGYDIHEGVMQLSLLRSPTYPFEEADQGEMNCAYSLVMHNSTFQNGNTVRFAYELNNPPTAIRATGRKTILPTRYSVVSSLDANVVCETVKPSDDGQGVIVRLYEQYNVSGTVNIQVGTSWSKAYLTDMLEKTVTELPILDGVISYKMRGFEILTIKLI